MSLARLLFACLLCVAAIPAKAAELTVAFPALKTTNGRIVAALFDSEAAWNGKGKAVRRLSVPATAGALVFESLPQGRYAVKAFHDLDGDGRLKSGPIRTPQEPYAFSNNAPARFGPPTWRAASFELNTERARQDLKLD